MVNVLYYHQTDLDVINMETKNFTYGIPSEKDRDLRKTIEFFKHNRCVRITMANHKTFSLFVSGYEMKSYRIFLGPELRYKKDNRVIIPVDYIISAERIAASEVDTAYKGQTTLKRGDFEDDGFVRSGKDFFQVIRYAHQQGKPIRVYLSDNRVLDGVSTGMNEQSAGIRLSDGRVVQVFYDWVDRIIPVNHEI
ncbi:hypothetical protein V5L67_002362 [Klebsiella pneumoniae]|uniref:hypothetical protein n=1 Tax=Klebsiella TaxID=570 RepID=UPI000B2ECAEF|nr:hypothetical protein [Klebsiella pneumoniae]HBM3148177.1 hypothetical protein [Klebsiella oxytoca]HBQ3760835.1 hypothetical protein [Klebsiella quasipneumoniae subsp. similipneumoniae]HCQ8667550.1 hypothetical protein [Klebsiella variicola]MCW0274041.1 hypothetical protein [Klebsiella pneumoniae]QMF85582.1 hypothetical protein HVY73_26805 [Klebsiella pneumoniae]